MAAATAWFLNLDADIELGARQPYAPTRRVLEAMVPHVARLAQALLRPGELLVDESSEPGCARGRVGRAFCPTPRAIDVLERAGAVPEPHPPIEVLRSVNGRSFAAALGPTLPGAAFVTDFALARAMLATPPPVGDAWRVKRAFGFAGRGQRVVRSDADLAFVRTAVQQGGAQIEPNVAIVDEYGLHGMLAQDGRCTLGALVVQRCDAFGAWVASERVSGDEVEGTLRAEARRVAAALHAAGYFGPFGIDAFTYRDREGRIQLQPRSEINARFSMGFPIGFGDAR